MAYFFFKILQLREYLNILYPLFVVLFFETVNCAIRRCHDTHSSPFFTVAVLCVQLRGKAWHLCCPVCFSVCDYSILSSLGLVAQIMPRSEHFRLDIDGFVEVSALSMLVLVFR